MQFSEYMQFYIDSQIKPVHRLYFPACTAPCTRGHIGIRFPQHTFTSTFTVTGLLITSHLFSITHTHRYTHNLYNCFCHLVSFVSAYVGFALKKFRMEKGNFTSKREIFQVKLVFQSLEVMETYFYNFQNQLNISRLNYGILYYSMCRSRWPSTNRTLFMSEQIHKSNVLSHVILLPVKIYSTFLFYYLFTDKLQHEKSHIICSQAPVSHFGHNENNSQCCVNVLVRTGWNLRHMSNCKTSQNFHF